jgi:uncharacterized protein (TIGR02569 family)
VSGERPSEGVLRAFNAGSKMLKLPGGQGTSWEAGGLVFKPSDGPVHQWLGESLDGLVLVGVRVAVPIASSDGRWTVDGWGATSFVSGSEPDLSRPSTWLDIIDAGRAFHRAVSHIRRPAFVDSRDDPWAVADRVAWGERSIRFLPELADIAARLLAQPHPPGEPQLVHCDLTGNVLFEAGLPPAVIDVSPYWRPRSYAEGVVVADVLCHHGADASALPLLGVPVTAIARALLFRMATTNVLVASGTVGIDLSDEAQRYKRAALALGI